MERLQNYELQLNDLSDKSFLRELHKRMFGDVWRWAGKYRKTSHNIGVDAYRIPMDIMQVIGDAKFWVDNATYSPDEITVRFSHSLVPIHPFPNRNGRFSRIIGDLLAVQLGQPRFSCGSQNLVDANATRTVYIAALRAADAHDINPLMILLARDGNRFQVRSIEMMQRSPIV